MAAADKKQRPSKALSVSDPNGQAELTPELTELLDHLASELAREYIRLMEKAAEEG
jgi:hypothetical protein